MTNGKNKGNQWERDISKKLSLWWTRGKDPNIFWRTAGSGGFFKGKKDLTGQSGDIGTLKPEGEELISKVSIEAKFYKSENSLLFEVLGEKRTQILKWWQQCENDALDARKVPLLIVKFNHQVPFIMFPESLYTKIEGKYGKVVGKTVLKVEVKFDASVFTNLRILKLDTFLEWCHPQFFKEFTQYGI